MVIKIDKPDFYSLLKKRRRTLKSFLDSRAIKTSKDLELLVQTLETEHTVSKLFLQDASELILNLNIASQESSEPIQLLKDLENEDVGFKKTKKRPRKKMDIDSSFEEEESNTEQI